MDTVVCTFTLCTIPGIIDAIRGFARILEPNGKLIFFELRHSPGIAAQRWKKRLEPVFHSLFQGLHLTRDIPALLMQSSFQIEQMERGYLAQFPKARPTASGGLSSGVRTSQVTAQERRYTYQ